MLVRVLHMPIFFFLNQILCGVIRAGPSILLLHDNSMTCGDIS